jgi:hypothetical protein
MGRLVIPALALVMAVFVAILFGDFAYNGLGIAIDTIRTDALASAGFLCVIVACGTFLKRSR